MEVCKEKEKPSYPKLPSNKYSLPYDQSNFTLVIDRLELSLKHNSDTEFNYKYLLEKYHSNNNIYQITDRLILKEDFHRIPPNHLHTFDVIIDGNKIAEINTDHRVMDVNYPSLKFENKVFYTSHFYPLLSLITDALPVQVNNIKLIEIAVDTASNPLQTLGYIYPLSNYYGFGATQFKGITKTVISCLHGNSFLIGSKETGKQISIYDKTEEIKFSDKTYITNFHSVNGLTINNIQRIEARLKTKYLTKLDIKIEDLTKENFLLSLFKQAVGESLCFKDLHSKSFDQNRNAKYNQINILDQVQLPETLETISKKVKKAPEKREGITRSETIAFKQLLFKYVATGNRSLLAAIRNMAGIPESFTNDLQGNYFDVKDYSGRASKYLTDYSGHLDKATLARITNIEEILFGGEVKEALPPNHSVIINNQSFHEAMEKLDLMRNNQLSN